MSDELRRRLARAAGDGDLSAAHQLVAILAREQGDEDEGDRPPPPMRLKTDQAAITLEAIDRLILEVLGRESREWLKSASRMCPRPHNEPGKILVGGALQAALVSTATPAFGWSYQYHYNQVIALAVIQEDRFTLGIGMAHPEYFCKPSAVWRDSIGIWSQCPHSNALPVNYEIPSQPLRERVARWASVVEVEENNPRSRLQFSKSDGLEILEALADGVTPWPFFELAHQTSVYESTKEVFVYSARSKDEAFPDHERRRPAYRPAPAPQEDTV